MAEQILKEKIASILQVSLHDLDLQSPLTSYGIDSLKAIEIQTFVEEKWRVECGFENLLNDLTLKDILSIISNERQKQDESSPVNPSSAYPLSYQQLGIRRFDEFSIDQTAYNIGKVIEIQSSLDVNIFEQSLAKLMEMHPSLRVYYDKNQTKEEQKIDSSCKPDFSCLSLSAHDVPHFLHEFALTCFDLKKAPLFRTALIQVAHQHYLLFIVFHHIIADLWSLGIFFNQLFQIYHTLLAGEEVNFPIQEHSYKEFVEFQQAYLLSDKSRKDLDFWLKICQEGDQLINLPYDFPAIKSVRAFSGKHHAFAISIKTSQKLKEFAQNHHTTPYICLLAAFELLIHFYSGQSNFYIGTTFPGRLHSKWHSCFGLFANILPVKVHIDSFSSFSAYMAQVKSMMNQVFEHSEMPFTYLLDQLSQKNQLQRALQHSPLFQALFVYQQVPSFNNDLRTMLINIDQDAPFIEKNGLRMRSYPWNIPVSPFEISLYMNESHDQFQGCFEYRETLFLPSTIRLASDQYLQLLDSLLENHPISPSAMLAPTQDRTFVQNEDASDTLINRFENQVKHYPHHILIADQKRQFTLKAADDISNRAAFILSKYKIQKGSVVAVLMDHSPEMIFVILAILKAGAILLPLDLHMPDHRIQDILVESQASLLISDEARAFNLMENIWFIQSSTFISELKAISNQTFPSVHCNSEIAYMIYTSGSTGKPKGIAISHCSLISYLTSITKSYRIAEGSHWVLYSPISFDLTLTSLFLPLFDRHTLHLYSRKIETFTLLTEILKNPQITHIKLTPSHLKYLKEIDIQPISLQQLIVGGEQLTTPLVQSIWNKYEQRVQIINEYGPTEATIGNIFGFFSEKTISSYPTMLVDQCLDNADYMICDVQLNEMPTNLTGELFLSGPCLAYGYWNRPDLTAATFIPHPKRKGERMYRTGDLVRRLPHEALLLLGRIDRQVKIHGFRIEMEEIEKKILEFPNVKECTVVLYDSNTKKIIEKQTPDTVPSICAYLVAKNSLSMSSLQEFLISSLPHYMRPSCLMICESLPLNVNGKIDFSKLPHPKENFQENSGSLILAQTAIQRQLVEIWSEVLHLPSQKIGINQHFFELGGDSITIIELVGKCKSLQLSFIPKDLYDNPTIERLAKFLENRQKQPYSILQDLQIPSYYSLSPIQNYFFKTHLIDPNHYHQAVILKRKEGFQFPAVKQTLQALIRHHDILRSVFFKQDNEWMGHIRDNHEVNFDCVCFEEEKRDEEVLHELQQKIDIQKGPLLYAGLYKNEGQDSLLIVIHHLLIDGVSWRILLEDFDAIYSKDLSEIKLHKTASYPTWIEHINHHVSLLSPFSTEKSDSSKLYRIANRQSWNQSFPKMTSENLLSLPFLPTQQVQTHHVLLTALSQSLPLLTESSRNSILMESHGRDSLSSASPDITRTVGWFTNLFPFDLENQEHETAEKAIKNVRQIIQEVPHHGIGYLPFLNNTNQSSPSICFNYLGQFDFQHDYHFNVMPILNDLISSNEQTPYHLEIILYINHQNLVLTLLYDSTYYEATKIEKFVQRYQTVLENLCEQLHGSSDLPHLLSALSVKQEDVEAISPMSPLQQGILFEEIRFPGQYYIEQACLEFVGSYDENQWKQAFTHLISQSQILRTVFCYEGFDHPKQVTLKTIPLSFEVKDFSHLSEEDQKQSIEEFLKIDKKKPFSLSKGPLMRVSFILMGKQHYQLVWSFHHIILDGWSLALLFQSLMDHLKPLTNPPILPSALDYYRYLDRLDRQSAKEYYQSLLADYHEPSKLPKRLERAETHKMEEISFSFAPEMIENLHKQAQRYGITLSSLLQTAWGILVADYSNSTDVVFGMVCSGRTLPLENIEKMIGLFIATLPVRVRFDEGMSFGKLCQEIQRQILQTQEYLHLSLADIQSLSPLKQNLIDHLFIFENYPLAGKAAEIVKQRDLPFHLLKAGMKEETPYPLAVTVFPGERYSIHLKYNSQMYATKTIRRLADNWQTLLSQVAEDASKPIAQLACISQTELSLLNTINDNEVPYDSSYIHNLFDQQWKQSSDRVSVIFGHHHVSYGELNRRASLLARFLKKQGFGAEDLIGIWMDRSVDMVICWLGILKAGCAYVPLNVHDPLERLEEIVKETRMSLILTHQKHCLPDHLPTLFMDVEWEKMIHMQNILLKKTPQYPLVSPKNLAYVIYTSGSTGKPKGIAMEHASVVNHIHWLTRLLSISKNDRILQCTDFSFDITICSFYGLFVGGTVVLVPPEDSKNMQCISSYLQREKISFVQLGSSLFSAMVQEEVFSSHHSLRSILCGGSPLNKESLRKWYQVFQTPILNLYGPTETCIDASYHRTSLEDLSYPSIPIGKPIDNDQVFILNHALNLCHVEAKGELYIGGAGVARGYYLRPDLTAETFLPHLKKYSQRMYKTGDICSLSSEMQLILYGRSDHQVKMRGLRIELKEIENVLKEQEGIKNAFVSLTGEGNMQRIVAYLIGQDSANEESLKKKLSARLPSYMIPSFFVFMDRFPLNERQKIDVAQLPSPFPKKMAMLGMAWTGIEKELLYIWSKILNIHPEKIQLNDNFFDLGGNSLILMQLQHQILKYFSKSVSIDSFFQYPSIKSYASFLQKEEEDQVDLQPMLNKRDKQHHFRNNRKAAMESKKNSSIIETELL